MQILECIIFLSFENLEWRKFALFFNYFSFIIFYYYKISEFHEKKMARTKQCPCANPAPSPSPTLPPPPPLVKVTIPAVTPPSLPLPPLPPVVSRASSPVAKSVPSVRSAPQIVVGPPLAKKISYPGPFIKGQVGTIFFSLDRVRNHMEIPHGHSLIMQSFHLRYKHELVFSRFVLVDPLGNSWSAPEVFNRWCSCVENHELEDIDPTKHRLAIVRFGNIFKLAVSDKKSKYQSQTHFIPAIELADEDERERKDLDFVPPKEEDDESD